MIYLLIICPLLVLWQTRHYNLPELIAQNKIQVFNQEIVAPSDNLWKNTF